MNPIKRIDDRLFSIFNIPAIILDQTSHYEWQVFYKNEIRTVFNSTMYGLGIVDIINDPSRAYRIYVNNRYFSHNENGYSVNINQTSFYWHLGGETLFYINIFRTEKLDDFAKQNIEKYPNLLFGNPLPKWTKEKINELL